MGRTYSVLPAVSSTESTPQARCKSTSCTDRMLGWRSPLIPGLDRARFPRFLSCSCAATTVFINRPVRGIRRNGLFGNRAVRVMSGASRKRWVNNVNALEIDRTRLPNRTDSLFVNGRWEIDFGVSRRPGGRREGEAGERGVNGCPWYELIT